MRIIFSVSFVGEAAIEKIKEIQSLIEYINKATKSTEIRKERTAKSIMWNVQGEQVFIDNKIKEEKEREENEHKQKKQEEKRLLALSTTSSQTSEINKTTKKTEDTYEYVKGDYQGWSNLLSKKSEPMPTPEEPKKPEIYDLMISYCHAQRDICHRIYDCLVGDKFRIWIDKENMYGSVLESMAEAIERSDIVIMCMSSKYKDSDPCKLEATYANKRKKKIIPIKVEEKYDPTGWLGLLCGDRQYIDFIKYGFDKAYKDLIKEITMIKTSDRK